MKTTTLTFNTIIIVIATILFILLISSAAHAQRGGGKKFYIGFDAGLGTRSFNISSDIEALDGLHANQEGFNLGVLVGGDVVRANIRKGFYKASATVGERIDIDEYELSMNMFP